MSTRWDPDADKRLEWEQENPLPTRARAFLLAPLAGVAMWWAVIQIAPALWNREHVDYLLVILLVVAAFWVGHRRGRDIENARNAETIRILSTRNISLEQQAMDRGDLALRLIHGGAS